MAFILFSDYTRASFAGCIGGDKFLTCALSIRCRQNDVRIQVVFISWLKQRQASEFSAADS
jgi:hypothetical protein